MRLFKKTIACFCSILLAASVFAAGGVMKGEENIQIVQTTWFDIIYGEDCADSAAVLYANADKIYLDLAEMYGWTKNLCRMPVILTTQVEDFNAYYTGSYYNHIVLYVTNTIEELANQPDTLLWTFRHELTHAFTYNMKNSFFTTVDKLFTDYFSFGLLTVTPGTAEGATLASESYEGNGRLNDEFTKHVVKQAKIEGIFPNFSDVQGSKDIYPSGDYYAFNGAFHEYLQKTYGLKKYAKFWYNCINNSIAVSIAFKKAYKISLKTAWSDFKNQYKVPEIWANPVQAEVSKDFFTPNTLSYSKFNNKGAVLDCLSASEKGLTYLDKKTSTVFFVDKEDFSSSKIKSEKLFQKYGLESAVQSPDGKYIAVTYINDQAANLKSHIAVYDTVSKKWYDPYLDGLKNAVIVQNGKDYYLVCLQFKGEHSEIRISRFLYDEKYNVCAESWPFCFEFGRNQIVNYFTPVSDGVFAYVLNDQLNYSVQLMDLKGNIIADYPISADELGPDFRMRYLSCDSSQNNLYFSWVCQDAMPRVGKLNLTSGEFTFSKEDISGGIFTPVVYENELVYIGQFYQQNRLFRKNENFDNIAAYYSDEDSFVEADENSSSSEFIEETDQNDLNSLRKKFTVSVPSLAETADVKQYKPSKYLINGLWLPFSTLTTRSFDSEHYGSYDLSNGITFRTGNPWDSDFLVVSAGYGTATNSAGVSVSYSSGTDTSLFNWAAGLFSEFDSDGFKAAEVSGSFTSVLRSYNYLSFNAAPSAFLHVGRSNLSPSLVNITASTNSGSSSSEEEGYSLNQLFGYAKGDSKDFYLFNQEYVQFYFDNVRKVDDNRFGYKGFVLGAAPLFKLSTNLTTNKLDYCVGDICLFGELYIPRLLPVECSYGQTTNLPVKLFASVFSPSLIYENYIKLPIDELDEDAPDFAFAAAEVLLYGKEIQKAVSFFPILFINDVKLSFVGAFGYDYPSNSSSVYFGFMQTQKTINGIAAGTLKPITILSLKFAAGFNDFNVGMFARSTMKSYMYFSPVVIIKGVDATPYITTGVDLQF